MLVNSIKTEKELQNESVEMYLKRIIPLLRREEIWRQEARENDQIDEIIYKFVTWEQKEDLMKLDKSESKSSENVLNIENQNISVVFARKEFLWPWNQIMRSSWHQKGARKRIYDNLLSRIKRKRRRDSDESEIDRY